MAKGVKWLLTGAVVAVVFALGFAFYQTKEKEKAEERAGLDATRAISETLRGIKNLEVQEISGEILVRSEAECGFGMLRTKQTARVKYTGLYSIPLSKLSGGAYHWNRQDRIISVDVPDVAVGKPAVDMANAVIKQEGIYICREAGIKMQRDAAVRSTAMASERANAPENINSARQSARKAIADLVNAPLAAAGLPNVRVVVRFPSDPLPAGISDEQWDLSRSIEEIYQQYGNAR